MAPAHVRRAAAAAAAAVRRCGSPVHHGAAAPTRLPGASGPDPLARAAAPTHRAIHHRAAAPTPRATHHRAAAPTPRATHHRAAAPSSFTPRRPFSDDAIGKFIAEEPPTRGMSFITREVSKIQEADIARHLELGKAVAQLTRDVTQGRSAARESRVKNALHVGTVTWRVCTTVITVTVAAGAGYLQLAKPGWEAAAEEDACMMITRNVDKMMLDLQEHIVKGVAKRRSVSSERSLLLQQKENRVASLENDIAARAALLDKWEADLVKKESGSN